MIKRFAVVMCAVLMVGCGGGGDDEPAFPNGGLIPTGVGVCGVAPGFEELSGVVERVVDGDTIDISAKDEVLRVRMLVVDAPEASQDYGAEATASLSRHVMGQKVKIATQKKDVYGRQLGLVFREDCTMVNLKMAEEGAAWFNRTYASDVPREVALALESAQAIAMLSKNGLWARPNPVEPWVYRK